MTWRGDSEFKIKRGTGDSEETSEFLVTRCPRGRWHVTSVKVGPQILLNGD